MNDIDQKIQAALRRETGGDELAGEPNIAEEVLTAFRGRHRGLSVLVVALQIAALIGLVFTALRFYSAPELAMQLRWGVLSLALFLVLGMIKVWFWLEMHSNRILREVKRVELLLVSRRQS
jgi:hypothetical protein